MANYICQNRHGTFYFRFIIPVQYRNHFKHKREIRYSLKTDSKRLALPRSRLYRVRIDNILERLTCMSGSDGDTFRTGLMTHVSIFGGETKVNYGDDNKKELEAVHELKKKDFELAKEMGLDPLDLIKLGNSANNSTDSAQTSSKETWATYSAKYVSDKLAAKHIRKGTVPEYKASYKLLSDYAGGDRKLVDFDNKLMTAFYQSLSNKSVGTRNKHLDRIGSVFKWAAEKEKVIVVNPVDAVMMLRDDVKDKDKRDMFDDEDLKKIFESDHYVKNTWRKRPLKVRTPYTFWMFPLALFTGARMSELMLMETENVHVDAKTPYIDLVNEVDPDTGEEILKIKNNNSIRKIPISDTLVEMGFIDFVKASRTRYVFPDLIEKATTTSAGQKVLKTRLEKTFKVWKAGRKSFHSLRHTFVNAAALAGVELKYLSAVTGHLSKKELAEQQLYREMVNTYFKGFPVEVLKAEVIDKLKFDVDFSGVRWPK